LCAAIHAGSRCHEHSLDGILGLDQTPGRKIPSKRRYERHDEHQNSKEEHPKESLKQGERLSLTPGLLGGGKKSRHRRGLPFAPGHAGKILVCLCQELLCLSLSAGSTDEAGYNVRSIFS